MNISAFIEHHPQYVFILSFSFRFLEGLPIIGTVVPGSFLMSPIGMVMAEQHHLFWPITWCIDRWRLW